MIVCPECAGPLENASTIESNVETSCQRCSWSGEQREALFVDEASLKIPEHQARLEALYKDIATHVTPIVGQILVQGGWVKVPDGENEEVDKQRKDFLIKILQGATRSVVEGIANVVREEMNSNATTTG